MPNEFLLVLDEGDVDVKDFIPEAEVMPSQPRAKGAYYKNIERKMLLKKKRVNVRIIRVAQRHRDAHVPSSSRTIRSRRSGI